MKCRKGGTLASGKILIVFLLVFFTVLQHISPFTFNGASSGSSTSGTTRGSCSSEQVIGAAAQGPPGLAAPNALALSSYIIQLPLQTSSKADGQLLNNTWWSEVFASSGQTFKDMPQGLYWGFLNDSQSMQDWINQSITDPPKWNSAGPNSSQLTPNISEELSRIIVPPWPTTCYLSLDNRPVESRQITL